VLPNSKNVDTEHKIRLYPGYVLRVADLMAPVETAEDFTLGNVCRIIDSFEDIRTSSVHPKGSGSQKPIDQDKVNPAVARASQGGSPPTKERIMVMYLTAPAGSSYSGDAIQKAAEAVGMRFGEMGVFHHFGIGKTPPRHSLFCLANLYEPGNFELSSMNTFQTSGLVLFMRLPGPVDGRVAFELMLNTALRLRERLGGELRDDRNEPLGAEQVERLRHRVTHG
jgi:cell division protein ZipA